MKRRKFINYLKNMSGVAFVGVSPVTLNPELLSQTSFEENNSMNNFFGRNQNAEKLFAEIKQYNGKPTLFVNGESYFPMAFISYYPELSRYQNMVKSGVRFFSLSITLGDRFIASHRKDKVKLGKKGIWDAPDKIDFDLFDRSIMEILDISPDCFIFPRIYCDSPGWWDSFHPAETNRTYDGFAQRQSFSSSVWRNDTAEVLRKVVRHIRQSSYFNRLIGLHITAGNTEEAVNHNFLGNSDYSLAAQNSFRQWVLHRYNNDENLIRTHFDKRVSELSIPSPQERSKAGIGDFLDPRRSKLVVDYNIFRCEEIVDSLDYLCRIVKEESNGNLLTGVFYGYTLVGWRDHSALARLLSSPNIDFLSNTNGAGRNTVLGENDMHFLSETDSIQKANKLFYYEADTRTCMSRWISELKPDVDPYHEYDLATWLGPETIEKTLNLLKAVFSRVICTGTANWWFDLWGGWYDHEQILDLFSEMQKIGDESIHLPRNSVSQVCVIVEEKSLLYYATSSNNAGSWIDNQISQIGRLGAPFDIYLASELKDIDVSRYNFFIFLNPIYLTQQDSQLIRELYMKDNKVLLWLYAPGLISDDISISNVSSIVKMNVGLEEKHLESEVEVSVDGERYTYKGLMLSPFLYIMNYDENVYGRTKDGYAVLCEKQEKNYTNVFASVPPVPWKVIQYFAKKSGVHIYSDGGDVVYANQSYLSVSATMPGKRIIRLPDKCRLEELFLKEEFKQNRNFEINFSAESCKLFRINWKESN